MPRNTATLNIDAELHRQLKIEAAKQGEKLGILAETLLREGLNKQSKKGE